MHQSRSEAARENRASAVDRDTDGRGKVLRHGVDSAVDANASHDGTVPPTEVGNEYRSAASARQAARVSEAARKGRDPSTRVDTRYGAVAKVRHEQVATGKQQETIGCAKSLLDDPVVRIGRMHPNDGGALPSRPVGDDEPPVGVKGHAVGTIE
jgi:hypothetical protein